MHYFYRQGPLDAGFLLQHCRDLVRRHAYVCGPEPLLERAQAILAGAGVPRRRIVTEEFTLL
jgi:ferredoxin-NADP reductase